MHDKLHTYARDLPSALSPNELIAERKQQIAQEQAAMEARKAQNLQKQRCLDTPPDVRIALWEGRHGLALPRSPRHPLLLIIAQNTDLDLDQVREEQTRRAQRRIVGHPVTSSP